MKLYFLLLCLWRFSRDFCEGCENGQILIHGLCERCPNSCSSCTSRPPCITCNVGYYGEYCLFSCPENCYNNECNKTTGQCLSCKVGYFMNGTKLCWKCPENCLTCNSENSCFACKNGFKGEYCQNVCSNCKTGTSCDKNTGYCMNDCDDGLSGELCDTLCDSKCKLCDRYNQHECISCASKRHGPSCNGQCSSTCLSNECDVRGGKCTNGCVDGFWGEKCDNICSTGCLKETCNRSNGNCTTIFKDDNTGIDTTKSNAFESHAPIGVILVSVSVVVGVLVFVLSFIFYRKRYHCGQRFPCLHKKKHQPAQDDTAGEQKHLIHLPNKSHLPLTDEEKGEILARQTDNNTDASVVVFKCSTIQVKQEDNGHNMDIINISITHPDIHQSVVDTFCKNHTLSLAEPITTEEKHNNTMPITKTPEKNYDACANVKITSFPKINCTVNAITPLEMDVISKNTDSSFPQTVEETNPSTGISTTIDIQPVISNGGCGNNDSCLDVSIAIPDVVHSTSTSIPLEKLADYVACKNSSSYTSEFKELVKSVYCTPSHSELANPKERTRQVVLENEWKQNINAYFIDGYKIADAYIVYMGSTQNVLSSDKNLFWKTVLQERCGTIVMLKIEDTTEEKCTCMNQSLPCMAQYKDVTVECNGEDNHDSFTIRKYTVKKQMMVKEVQRLKFAKWPLHGMPDDVSSLVNFVKSVNKVAYHLDGPIMLYNSFGIERTGLYIALDILMKQCEDERCVDIYGCVRHLKELKLNLIPNCDQYEFLHKALVFSLTPNDSGTDRVDSTNTC